jgi:hypothetical protein
MAARGIRRPLCLFFNYYFNLPMDKLQAMLRLMESDEYLLITKTKDQEGITYNRDMTDSNAKRFCMQVYNHIFKGEATLNAFKKLFN